MTSLMWPHGLGSLDDLADGGGPPRPWPRPRLLRVSARSAMRRLAASCSRLLALPRAARSEDGSCALLPGEARTGADIAGRSTTIGSWMGSYALLQMAALIVTSVGRAGRACAPPTLALLLPPRGGGRRADGGDRGGGC